jgi:hypothetical protein
MGLNGQASICPVRPPCLGWGPFLDFAVKNGELAKGSGVVFGSGGVCADCFGRISALREAERLRCSTDVEVLLGFEVVHGQRSPGWPGIWRLGW